MFTLHVTNISDCVIAFEGNWKFCEVFPTTPVKILVTHLFLILCCIPLTNVSNSGLFFEFVFLYQFSLLNGPIYNSPYKFSMLTPFTINNTTG